MEELVKQRPCETFSKIQTWETLGQAICSRPYPPFSSPYDEILINSHTTFFPLELSLRLLLLGIKLPLLSRGQFDSVYTSFESMHAQVILLQ